MLDKLKVLLKPSTTLSPSAAGTFPQGIKVLYEPEGNAEIDILFVHGLTGDRERTWNHPDVVKSWPELLLPSSFPDARILTFGYDAYVVRTGPATLNRIRDHAKDLLNELAIYRDSISHVSRPIIIVAHSLGGLVCKDAVLLSGTSSDQHLKDMSANTIGIVFMGTPHGGSWVANWLKIPVISLGVIKSTNCSLLSVLQINSEVLGRLHDDFLSTIRARERSSSDQAIEIICFCEALPMSLIGPIVPSQSASLPGFNKITIHANHRDMVRFKTKDDPGYKALISVLVRWQFSRRFDRDSLLDHDQLGCLQSLSFKEIETRQINIESANQDTCNWIYENQTYMKWEKNIVSGETMPLLWLKGKPGSGKSTLMKELYKSHCSSAQDKNPICLGFFFNGRGKELEKTPLGLYRTLVYQLIQQSNRAMKRIGYVYREKEKKLTQIEWHLAELRDFFHQMMNDLEGEMVEIFVDALDECNDDDVRRIVKSFEGSLSKSMATYNNLKVCWSSRHYPHISLRGGVGLELRIEDHNTADIVTFVHRELVLEDQNLQRQLGLELTRRANGVFLWTVLVIKILLKASDKGLQPRAMRTLLDNTPSELHELFKSILCSLDHHENESLAMFQWILGSQEPLSPSALRLALWYSRDILQFPPVESEPEGPYSKYEQKQYERYIVDASGGLLELAYSKLGQPIADDSGRSSPNEILRHQECRHIVQIIHESVSDFFTKEDGAKNIGFDSSQDFVSAMRRRVTEACQRLLHDPWISAAFLTAKCSSSASLEDFIASLQGQIPQCLQSLYFNSDFPCYVAKHGLQHFARHSPDQTDTRTIKETIQRWSILYNSLLRAFLISADDLLSQTRAVTGLFPEYTEEIKGLMAHFGRVFDDLLVIHSPGRRGSVEDLRQAILLQRFASTASELESDDIDSEIVKN